MDSDTAGEIENVDNTTKVYLKKHYFRVVLLVLLVIVLSIPIVYAGFETNNPKALEFLIIPLGILIFGYRYIKSKIEHAFIQQFATQHGFSYQAIQRNINDITSTYLQRLGRRQFLEDIVIGTYNNFPLRLYTFATVVGHGKGVRSLEFSVFELQYTGDVLDIILDSHIHQFDDLFTSPFSGKKKLTLEGNFDKYFTVYVPDGYEMETLEILTPDIMEEFVQKSSLYSFEFNNNKLFIFANKLIGAETELNAMYDFSQILVTQLAPILSKVKNDYVK